MSHYLRIGGIVRAATLTMTEWEASQRSAGSAELDRRHALGQVLGDLRRDLWQEGAVTLDPMLTFHRLPEDELRRRRALLVARLAEQRRRTPRLWRSFSRGEIDRLRAIALTLRIRAAEAAIPEQVTL